MPFTDRRQAGRRLAERLRTVPLADPVVLGLPRGGIPVAYEVARTLGAPLDVLVVRKLGCPWQPELALGAIGEGRVRILNQDLIRATQVTPDELDVVAERETRELDRRVQRYRRGRPITDLTDRDVVIVDDGLATGATAKAGVRIVRHLGARRVVVAVPVGARDAAADLARVADEVVCLETPRGFTAIGGAYADFSPTSDTEVESLLTDAAARPSVDPAPAGRSVRQVDIPVGRRLTLHGDLVVPAAPRGLVVFAHGSGSSRSSPRNVAVARTLDDAGFATLLFDLLTIPESADRARVFDIELLAGRLVATTRWVRREPSVSDLRLGYFGASTGAAAALWAAAELGDEVAAVVSRGGRPDLAGQRLARVTAPTLLIVGSRDQVVLDLNVDARRHLRCPSHLEVVPGATHLFEEPGALATVADLAGAWFARHLSPVPAA
jgi:putative phosphoribosyl transferase